MSHNVIELLRQQEGEGARHGADRAQGFETGAQLRDVLREPAVVETR